ncbi:MAG: sulfatase [Planctomycetota bacterium]|jgi:arylsulfatase A-like enzyme|nr:sulfatase [Planctomycetota bacterium]
MGAPRNRRLARPSPRAIAATCVLVASAAAAACTDGSSGGGAGAARRAEAAGGGPRLGPLSLTALSSPRTPEPDRVVARFVPSRDGPLWPSDCARSEFAPLPGESDGAEGLYLFGSMEKTFDLPGPMPSEAFNRVAVNVWIQSHSRMRMLLLRDGLPFQGSGQLDVWSSNRRQRIVGDFALTRFLKRPAESIRFRVGAHAGPVCVESVELIWKDVHSWLPAPGGAPTPLGIDGEDRLATVVSHETGVGEHFLCPEDATLAFSCALPGNLRFPGQAPTLVATVRSDDHTSETRIRLESDIKQPVSWHDEELSLARWGGERIAVSFELKVKGPHEAFALLETPRILAPTNPPPTVVLITSDTHRADHVGIAGTNALVQTPNIDALAKRGVLFEHCYSTSNITIPSHVAILTGRHPRDTRIVDNVTSLARGASTLAEVFRANGYRTFAAVSTHHLGDALSGLGQGFDRMAAPRTNERSARDTRKLVERWLLDSQHEPVFLWLHFFDAHYPYEAPEPFDAAPREDIADTQEMMDYEQERYRGEVSYLDTELGPLLRVKRIREGIIALTSDHGECLGQHDIFFEHAELYTDTLHVPLILSWPGCPPAVRVSERVQNHDLGRTLLDLAGLNDEPFPGRSLVGTRRRAEPNFALSYGGRSAAVTIDRWHLILHLQEHTAGNGDHSPLRERHETELYDIGADHGCGENLIEREPAVASRLRDMLLEWLAGAEETGLATDTELSEADLEALRGIGYVGRRTRRSGDWAELDCDCDWCGKFE